MNVPVPPSDFDTAESSRSTEAFAWINSDKSPEVSDATVREVLPQLAVQLRDRFSLSLSETVELLHYVSVDCETRPALAEIEQIAEETYSADRKATAARPGKRYASAWLKSKRKLRRWRKLKKTSDRASSAETSDQLGPKLEMRLIGGRLLGAFRSKSNSSRSGVGPLPAAEVAHRPHQARPY
jgi:hypothetical protein